MRAGLKTLILIATLVSSVTVPAGAASSVSVIPLPAHIRPGIGAFTISSGTRISASGDVRAIGVARYFAQLVSKTRGTAIEVVQGAGRSDTAARILFEIRPQSARADPEGYSLEISPEAIVLAATDARGLLYGAVTLWQLCTASPVRPGPIQLPAISIEDAPRFRWRGLLLDSARHFQSPDFILKLIDWMALHKLNVLQWHLTDDQGWRLQIRRYPRLTDVGAWRVPAGAGAAADIDPGTGRPRLYGGFYTQQTVRRIVAHAALRNVTIVPEIDMPGHATAAIVAYPTLASTPEPPTTVPSDWGVYPNLFNADEQTFSFLENVLSEVLELFPGQYVDVGGDEAIKDQWHASAHIRSRMHELGVTDEQALQSYFIRRVEQWLHAHGRRLVGWDEILEGGLPPQATVMSWRGLDGAVAAAHSGHEVVLSPAPVLYLDNRQGSERGEPPGRGQIVTLEQLYEFDPRPAVLSAQEATHILGVQANIWTEHIRTEERVQYMTFPRAAALSELGWSRPQDLSWEKFAARLPDELRRYRALGIHASEDAFAVSIEARMARGGRSVQVQLTKQAARGQIRYTLDQSDPTQAAALYTGPLTLPVGGKLRAAAFDASGALTGVSVRSLDAGSIARRWSQELKTCTNKLVLNLEDDAPVQGPRAIFLVDLLNPCWIYKGLDLSQVAAVKAAVGQVPFNFQVGAAREAIRFDKPASADGELEVRIDSCEGEPIAVLPLSPALASPAVTALPTARISARSGVHDLCFRFAQPRLDPLWVLDWVEPVG